MKKILLSLLTVGAVTGTAFAATSAFFSDTETSTGNIIQAGKIDLLVDSECHYFRGGIDQGCAGFGSWASKDLTDQDKFFNFTDVKPGDWGENTISLKVVDNDAWTCVDIKNLVNAENTIIDPEAEAGDITNDPNGGELAQNVKFTAWKDEGATPGWQGKAVDLSEGDNVWQPTEPTFFTNEPAGNALNGTTLTLAEGGGTPLTGGVTHYVGLAWCAGNMSIVNNALVCDGALMDNKSQSDSLSADVSFRVEQSRNNPNFKCKPN